MRANHTDRWHGPNHDFSSKYTLYAVMHKTYPLAFILRRLETFSVMESNICFSDWRRSNFFSDISRLEPRLRRDREEGRGGERSMRGNTLTFVLVPEPVSLCELKERK